jgi:hypothetical protein
LSGLIRVKVKGLGLLIFRDPHTRRRQMTGSRRLDGW